MSAIPQQPAAPHPVILDTDIGTDIDDTWALAMLLNCPELDPRLILSATGDTTYRARIAAKFLAAAGRSDIPIGIGIPDTAEDTRLQLPWLGEYDLTSYPGPVHEDGVHALINTVMESTEPVTLIAIAAATNIARALEREPRLAPKCRLVGMFGSVDIGYDGNPGAVAESNVKGDPEALRRVLAAPWIDVTLTPLDTCGMVALDGERYQSIVRSANPANQALIDTYRIWSDIVPWMTVNHVDERSTILFDTVAVYLAYSHEHLDMQPLRLAVTDDGFTRRDTASTGNSPEALTAMRWLNKDAFLDHLVERLRP